MFAFKDNGGGYVSILLFIVYVVLSFRVRESSIVNRQLMFLPDID